MLDRELDDAAPPNEWASLRRVRTRTSEVVAQHLRELIFAAQLKPGTPLRVHHIIEQLGTSATPVREALVLLEAEGLVESELHRGFRVKRISRRDIEDVFALHAFAAGKLAQRAATLLTPSELAELARLDQKMRMAVRSAAPQQVERLNFQFHRLINRAAASPLLMRYLANTSRYVPRRFVLQISGWVEASSAGHKEILDALVARDGERARQDMERHIQEAGRLLADHLLMGRVTPDSAN
jgi:DNA-binding GntR family transcriptional regulator